MQGELEVAKSINDEFDPDELNNVEQNYVSLILLQPPSQKPAHLHAGRHYCQILPMILIIGHTKET